MIILRAKTKYYTLIIIPLCVLPLGAADHPRAGGLGGLGRHPEGRGGSGARPPARQQCSHGPNQALSRTHARRYGVVSLNELNALQGDFMFLVL